jgi:hypothetical protein
MACHDGGVAQMLDAKSVHKSMNLVSYHFGGNIADFVF